MEVGGNLFCPLEASGLSDTADILLLCSQQFCVNEALSVGIPWLLRPNGTHIFLFMPFLPLWLIRLFNFHHVAAWNNWWVIWSLDGCTCLFLGLWEGRAFLENDYNNYRFETPWLGVQLSLASVSSQSKVLINTGDEGVLFLEILRSKAKYINCGSTVRSRTLPYLKKAARGQVEIRLLLNRLNYFGGRYWSPRNSFSRGLQF